MSLNLVRESAKIEDHIPRSTSLKGLPLAKIIFGPPYWKASFAVHSAAHLC